MKTARALALIVIILGAVASAGCGGGGGGSAGQPSRADVFIAFDQPITNLAGLDFVLANSTGATFDNSTQQISAVNAALGSLAAANFDPLTNTNRIVLINGSAAGIDTGAAPIVKVVYDVAPGSGRPTFSISSQGTFSAIAPDNGPTTPSPTAANLVVTVVYE